MARFFDPSRVAVVLLAAALASCGGDGKDSTTNPPVTNPPATTPTTTLAPQVLFDPLPGFSSCSKLGPGKDGNCRRDSPTFQADVDAVLDELISTKSNLFENSGSGLKVRSTGQFYVAFIQALDKRGLCAAFDGEEVGIKNNDNFNDQYHMVTSDLILRRGESSYRTTCFPASFPGPERGYAPKNGCTLPSSREITCGRESSQFVGAVGDAIDTVVREKPDLFDLNARQPGPGWYKITNLSAYDTAVAEALKAKGLCARHDGEELVVKGANTLSEHFDISTADGNIRRGDGSYRSTCYPAAF
jgi:hypothetical protein